ncbi:MAG: germination protein YpeB [Bacillus sp. (in: firmicutes)]
MSRALAGTIIGVLSIFLIGTAYWGYQEHQQKMALLISSENNYQRSFHNLSYRLDNLNDQIGTTLAMKSKKTLSPGLTDIWYTTSEAQHVVDMLPLSVMEFSKTEEFLDEIGQFSQKTASRDLDKEPLTREEYKRLEELYKQSGELQRDLRQVQSRVLADNLSWNEVEAAYKNGNRAGDTTIVDGFTNMEKKVTGYREAQQEAGTRTEDLTRNSAAEDYRKIQGKEITAEEAVGIAKRFVDYGDKAKVSVEENGIGTKLPFYTVKLSNPDNDNYFTIDLTKTLGYPIMFLNSRPVGEAKISLNEAGEKAASFLKKQKYPSMELFESSQYDSVGIFHFVHTENGVRVYSDSIKVKVALDDGTITGYSAEDYLRTNKDRTLKEPALTLEEAKEAVHGNVKVMEDRLAVITGSNNEEVLCYELVGTMNDETYRILINAENGEEELIEKLDRAEPRYGNL